MQRIGKLARPVALALAAGLALSACNLPRGAAVTSEVLNAARDEAATFQVVPVTRAMAATVARWPATGWAGGYRWLAAGRGPDSPVLRPGDRIDLVIWDSQQNSLLVAPEARMARMEGLTVSATGTIFVPYLEEVVVSGMTPEQARFAIQTALAPIVPSAQVQLGSEAGRKNSVDLVSGVARPGSYPLPDRNYSILSLIAAGGGIAPSLRNPLVRLIRDGDAYEIPSARLFAEAATNITLRGGDQVLVEEDRRYFTALGAAGQEELIYFRKEGLSALEALSEMGGLAESRANPKGVLVLREYPAAALRADGSGPQKSQVVFAFDLTSADGLFAARNFAINPRDTVLATESPVTAARTIIGIVGTVIGVANSAGNI